ncbi:uncharacterized protein NECHADRAFT_89542 [Fusarium vanettenii 77-13-4]|uniref:Uncharacterized protein n=1 Tax=Fusarium vanettenii (strain ATCC MYA-4622 / CBS 123669 / FGSC 9596 / NRRL 45880 / 77-13-4) TaxID=660122 RepID=C7ZRI1_FUSV7|nr:uncharacterized protein NECHADRAFT_89542 [Fusarium vanettenii 77-13-4]EEU33375.1 hypothetical protein NECHADRAFT_89542 [Fusarium vanettenii 77-13-4]
MAAQQVESLLELEQMSADLPYLNARRRPIIPDEHLSDQIDHFGLTIFMASVLGRVTRWVFQHSISDSQMPWDSRSEFSRLAGILVNFESYSEADNVDLAEILGRDYAPDGNGWQTCLNFLAQENARYDFYESMNRMHNVL